MAKYLVGIDEGTTGCKTCVFDLAGNILGTAYREYPATTPTPVGWSKRRKTSLPCSTNPAKKR